MFIQVFGGELFQNRQTEVGIHVAVVALIASNPYQQERLSHGYTSSPLRDSAGHTHFPRSPWTETEGDGRRRRPAGARVGRLPCGGPDVDGCELDVRR